MRPTPEIIIIAARRRRKGRSGPAVQARGWPRPVHQRALAPDPKTGVLPRSTRAEPSGRPLQGQSLQQYLSSLMRHAKPCRGAAQSPCLHGLSAAVLNVALHLMHREFHRRHDRSRITDHRLELTRLVANDKDCAGLILAIPPREPHLVASLVEDAHQCGGISSSGRFAAPGWMVFSCWAR